MNVFKECYPYTLMVFIKIKNIKSKKGDKIPYAYLCKSVREGKKVRSIHIKYLGKVEGIGRLDSKTITKVFEIFDYKCMKCDTDKNLVVDHIIPLSKDGTNELENLQILCSMCNFKKGNHL